MHCSLLAGMTRGPALPLASRRCSLATRSCCGSWTASGATSGIWSAGGGPARARHRSQGAGRRRCADRHRDRQWAARLRHLRGLRRVRTRADRRAHPGRLGRRARPRPHGWTPGSIVVADNLAAHKVAGVRECLEAAGMGLLFLPPYSPDFNPIEQAIAKIKALLRRMAPRSFDASCKALKAILDRFSSTECSHYLRHSGYVQA
jgi:transposase